MTEPFKSVDKNVSPCPYCSAENKAIGETFFAQDCAGCVERMGKPFTVFQCKLDKSACDHDWNNEGCNPTHCLKCGQSFTAYAFMEAP